MALNVSAWSIRQPLPAIVFSLIMLALGWMSFLKLPITRLPNADIPVVSVVVAEFGAAPAELEAQVTKPIEDAVSGVEGVHNINSTITDGVSATTIMFSLESNTDRALNDVKDAVTRVRGSLPQNISEPLVQRVDVVGLPILTYAAISPGMTPEQLSWYVDNVVIRALQGVHGVAQVERVGGVEREILSFTRSATTGSCRADCARCQSSPARDDRQRCRWSRRHWWPRRSDSDPRGQ